jgi:twitching motility protein PilU
LEREQAIKYMRDLLTLLVEKKGSDLFVTADFPPAIKVDGKVTPVTKTRLTPENTKALVYAVMNDRHIKEFESTKECNFVIAPSDIGRFRCNAFVRMGSLGIVLRVIQTRVPTIDQFGLPPILKEIAMTKRGLVILAGATGSGKSTTLAAMIDHRNEQSYGHIITIEDPIEFVHPHKNCIVTQREVGVDTFDWESALKNTLRQAPDVILLGEIRDRETMKFALDFAETGHLALATLHSNNANQVMERIVNFFPEERRPQLLMDLSLNLRAVVSQRLLRRKSGKGMAAAVEVLLNSPLVSDLILKGEIHVIREVMGRSSEAGMRTFDQALFDLHEADLITYEDALRNADSMNELRIRIKLEGKAAKSRNLLDELGHIDIEGVEEESGLLR